MPLLHASRRCVSTPRITLGDLPSEILLAIFEHVIRDATPGGSLLKGLGFKCLCSGNPPARNFEEGVGPYLRHGIKIIGEDFAKRIFGTILQSQGGCDLHVMNWTRSPDLRFLRIDRRFCAHGLDALYSMSTITMTSQEVADMIHQTGMRTSIRKLRMRERRPEHSLLLVRPPQLYSRKHKSWRLIRDILSAPHLQSLDIDLEPFFYKDRIYLQTIGYIFCPNGLQNVLRTLRIVPTWQWSCTGIGKYVLLPKRPSDCNTCSGNNPKFHLTDAMLRKLTLTHTTIDRTWQEALRQPEWRLQILAARPTTPPRLRRLRDIEKYISHVQAGWRSPNECQMVHHGFLSYLCHVRLVTEGYAHTRDYDGLNSVARYIRQVDTRCFFFAHDHPPLLNFQNMVPGSSSNMNHFWTQILALALWDARNDAMERTSTRMRALYF